MIRLAFLLNLAVTPLLASEKPNILFIFTDDQTYKSVSCYDGAWSWCETPHLDRLAAEGVRFQNAYSGPWCSPSRAMMMQRSPASCAGASADAAQGGGRLAPMAAGVEAGGLSLRLHRQMGFAAKTRGRMGSQPRLACLGRYQRQV